MGKICRVCSNKESFRTVIARDYFLGSKEEYEYALCSTCNSLSLQEIPDNLANLYKNYYSFNQSLNLSYLKKLAYSFILKHSNFFSGFLCKCLKSQDDLPIKSFQPFNLPITSKILDVGCGSGVLLNILNNIGYKNCLGIDPFLETDMHHPNGISLLRKDFLDLQEKFDLIMFHHVFEHFPNPIDVLLHVEKLLTKNGLCLIRMPDVDSYSFLRYKQNWFSIHAPFHISLPSRSGMRKMIESTQMKIQGIIGEQLMEFFLYSRGHELGVADYEEHGNRKFIEKYGIRKVPPLHTKGELKEAKQRLKQVKKYNLCDWSVYYIRKR